METRSVEIATFESSGMHLDGIHWSAVFAGLVVGLGMQLLLMLIGIAAGFAVYGTGGRPDGSSLPLAAALWNTCTLVIAALLGGYVAARSSGLRRSVDGMLHGAVAWGAAMLCFAFLTGSVTGSALSSAFGIAASTTINARGTDGPDSATIGELLASIERGDRAAAIDIMRDRFGLDQEQATRATDRALAMTGRAGAAASGEVHDAAQTASAASAWLSGMILLSLLGGAGGGLLGARGARKRTLPARYRVQQSMVRTADTQAQQEVPLPG